MNSSIKEYYPDPTYYSYLYLREVCGEKDSVDLCKCSAIDQQHIEDLKISGFLKQSGTDGNIITLKENGRWLCDPPERKVKQRKDSFKNPRLDKLADITGYPIDWHKRAKYEGLFRSMEKLHSWETLLKVAEYFRDNKTKPDLVLNYFLSKDGFKGIKYHMENPKRKEEDHIMFRGDLTKEQDSQECLF